MAPDDLERHRKRPPHHRLRDSVPFRTCSFATRGKRSERNCDQEECGHIAPEVGQLLGVSDRLDRHDRAVHDAGPYGEPNKAQVGKWIPCGQEQEHTESRIDAKADVELRIALSK